MISTLLLLFIVLAESNSAGVNTTKDGIIERLSHDILRHKAIEGHLRVQLGHAHKTIDRLTEEMKKIQTIPKWHLGMNLNPSDGHIMDYTTGWADDYNIGSADTALIEDYLNREVWNMPISRIAIVRHQKGLIDAVKVWEFKKSNESLQSKFSAMNPGREIVTKGGPKQVFMVRNMANSHDDPIFSVSGDIAMNWWYSNNGNRIALTGGHLSDENVNDDNTHGLGNHYTVDGKIGKSDYPQWAHEISNIQDCPRPSCPREDVKIQGTDHGWSLRSGPVYGNYAIYVSKDADKFPTNKRMLKLEVNDCF